MQLSSSPSTKVAGCPDSTGDVSVQDQLPPVEISALSVSQSNLLGVQVWA